MTTNREQQLAEAVERFLAVDETEIGTGDDVLRMVDYGTAVDAMRAALALAREGEGPSGAVTLWLAEPRNTLVHEVISGVVRLCDGAPIDTQEHPLGAWLLPTAMHGRLAIVAIADLFATTRNVVPPLALDGDG